MTLAKVISGGQSGADQAAWRAAKSLGIPTGGWMPKGFLTEDGPRPEFAEMYRAKEHKSREYLPRTKANILEADFTLVLSQNPTSPGTLATVREAAKCGRPCIAYRDIMDGVFPDRAFYLAKFLVENGFRIVNVSGNRESVAPGIGVWVERFLIEVFMSMKETS